MSSSIEKIEKEVEKEVKETIQETVAGDVDTKDTKLRYLAFLARIRPIVQPAARYLAYTSDVGEAFRPVVKPLVVTGAYGVSWMYVLGDVGYEGYKANHLLSAPVETNKLAESVSTTERRTFVGLKVAERAVFQASASMLFPALTIHSIVKYSAKALKRSNVQSAFIKAWGPSSLGLMTIPALPYLFDEPVEKVVEKVFAKIEERVVTPEAREKIEARLKSHGHGHSP